MLNLGFKLEWVSFTTRNLISWAKPTLWNQFCLNTKTSKHGQGQDWNLYGFVGSLINEKHKEVELISPTPFERCSSYIDHIVRCGLYAGSNSGLYRPRDGQYRSRRSRYRSLTVTYLVRWPQAVLTVWASTDCVEASVIVTDRATDRRWLGWPIGSNVVQCDWSMMHSQHSISVTSTSRFWPFEV
jgi:hypothetical protein